jgi:hypothetical protein
VSMIVGISAWYADVGKHLMRRVEHLLNKRGVSEWVWIVRESNDCTLKMLEFAKDNAPVPVTILVESWDKPADRLLACSLVGDVAINAAIGILNRHTRFDEGHVLIHESDLMSPEDVTVRLQHTVSPVGSRGVIGAWPCLASNGMDESLDLFPGAARLGKHINIMFDGQPAPLPLFYDTWGYRLNGQRFASVPPYSPCYTPDQPFMLDTVGSVALIDAWYLRNGARMEDEGFVGLCNKVRKLGGKVWCDPRIIVSQPLELWTFQQN